jgi:membrane protease subunit HflK
MAERGPMTRRSRTIPALAALALAAYTAWGVYGVQPDESGVELVFGRVVARDVLPGIHWNPPPPFGTVLVDKTATSFVMPVGYQFIERPGEPATSDLWLTADTNVVTLRVNIQYSVRSLADFALSHEQPRQLLRRAGERVITAYLAGQPVDAVLTNERQRLAAITRDRLQEVLDREGVGISVQSVSIEELGPPLDGGVRSAFQEVQNSSSDRERVIHEAHAYAAQTHAQAEGEGQAVRDRAYTDRHARIEGARGESARFAALAREHARAPGLTEQRLYLESIDRLMPKTNLYVVEPGPGGKVNLRIVR